MTAQEILQILQMIETVSPDDAAALDEIDARVWCYIHKCKYLSHKCVKHKTFTEFFVKYESYLLTSDVNIDVTYSGDVSQYTRSRDALKAIRPAGWLFSIRNIGECWNASFTRPIDGNVFDESCELIATDGYGATEELAELHAILQAIEHERAGK